MKVMDHHLKYRDDWFANIIATDPVHQRKGYASAMIKEVIRVVRGIISGIFRVELIVFSCEGR